MKALITKCTSDGSYQHLVGKTIEIYQKEELDTCLFNWCFSEDYPALVFLTDDCLILENVKEDTVSPEDSMENITY